MIKIPFSAPLPVPTIIDTGVAKPRAQGHDITRTAIPIDNANSKSFPTNNHIIVANIAIVITTGTKMPLTLSANFPIGALLDDAFSTNVIICAKVVSSPTFCASILILPF